MTTIFDEHQLYHHIHECVTHAQDHFEGGEPEKAHKELSDAGWAIHKLQSDLCAEIGIEKPSAQHRPKNARGKLTKSSVKLG